MTRLDIHSTRTLDEIERDAYLTGDAVRAALAARLMDTEADLKQMHILCDEIIDALRDCYRELEAWEMSNMLDPKLVTFIESII